MAETKKPSVPNGKKPRIVKLEMGFHFDPKKSLLWILLILLFVPFLFSLLRGSGTDKVSLSDLLKDVKSKKIEKIEIDGSTLSAKYTDGSIKVSRKED